MLAFLNRYKRNSHRTIDESEIARAVGHYLLQLPRCSTAIVGISPRYGELHYRCEIVLDVAMTLEWARNHAANVISLDFDDQAARLALPLWLGNFDETNRRLTDIPAGFYKVLRPYIRDLVNEDVAAITCLECGHIASQVLMQRVDEESIGTSSRWTDVWRCSSGHLLYHEDHEVHFYLGRTEE